VDRFCTRLPVHVSPHKVTDITDFRRVEVHVRPCAEERHRKEWFTGVTQSRPISRYLSAATG
jgi:hypothetical protein